MYVVERATLAHSVIHSHLMTKFPTRMTSASSYLQSYSGVVGTRWRTFGTTLDHVAKHPTIADKIIASANDAFRCQRRWLQQEQMGSSVRVAG